MRSSDQIDMIKMKKNIKEKNYYPENEVNFQTKIFDEEYSCFCESLGETLVVYIYKNSEAVYDQIFY